MQNPTVARMVHYVGVSGDCRAAVVTGVRPRTGAETVVVMHVMPPDDECFNAAVFYGDPEEKLPGTWHWPERVG